MVNMPGRTGTNTERPTMKNARKIAAKFPGTCKGCSTRFAAGEQVRWTKSAGVTRCPECTPYLAPAVNVGRDQVGGYGYQVRLILTGRAVPSVTGARVRPLSAELDGFVQLDADLAGDRYQIGGTRNPNMTFDLGCEAGRAARAARIVADARASA